MATGVPAGPGPDFDSTVLFVRGDARGLRPVLVNRPGFWTDRWQEMEREADADIAAGRVVVVEGVDDLIAHLDA